MTVTDFIDTIQDYEQLALEIGYCPQFRFRNPGHYPGLTLFNEASYSLEVFGRVAQLE